MCTPASAPVVRIIEHQPRAAARSLKTTLVLDHVRFRQREKAERAIDLERYHCHTQKQGWHSTLYLLLLPSRGRFAGWRLA